MLKEVSETIKNKAKEQKSRFLPVLFGTLAASLLGSVLAGNGVLRASEWVLRAGERTNKAVQNF